MTTNTFDFIGGDSGKWKVVSLKTVCGLPLEIVSHLDISPSLTTQKSKGIWTLTGFISNVRYAEKEERENLLPFKLT